MTDTNNRPKIIAVIGATGLQGGALVRAILADTSGGFVVRALTRDPTKEKATALASAGATVVKFDLDDPATYKQAISGAYGLFVVTNYFEHFDTDKEIHQAKSIAKFATEEAGVKHVIWSTNEDSRPFFDNLSDDDKPTSNDKGIYIENTDGKGFANQFFPQDKTTFFYTSMYLENFFNFGMIQNGVFANNLGDTPLSVIAAEDIGKCAYGVFKAGTEYHGRDVYVAGMQMTCEETMNVCSEVLGKKFGYAYMDRDAYAALGFPAALSIANYFHYHTLNPNASKNRSVEKSKLLNPDLITDMKVWVEANKDQLLVVGPKD